MEYRVTAAGADDGLALFRLAYICLKEAGFSPLIGGVGKSVNPSAVGRACREGRVLAVMTGDGPVASVTLTKGGAENLFVLPAMRKKGLGGALLEAAEGALAARGCEEMALTIFLPDGFYLKRGYKLVRRKKVLQGGEVLSVAEEFRKDISARNAGHCDGDGVPCKEGKFTAECTVMVKDGQGRYLLMKRAAGLKGTGYYECTASGVARRGESVKECAARVLSENTALAGQMRETGREKDGNILRIWYLFECEGAEIALNGKRYAAFKWTKRCNALRSVSPFIRRARKYLLLRKRAEKRGQG